MLSNSIKSVWNCWPTSHPTFLPVSPYVCQQNVRCLNISEKQSQNTKRIRHQTTPPNHTNHIHEHSYGGYIFKRLGNIISQGRFTHQEQETSSTSRELIAIKTCLQSFSKHLQHEAVEVRTDNFNATKIIEKGSRKPHVHSIALDIFKICTQHDILLKTTWIPREQNQYADRLSKMTDTDDWSIDQETFNHICQQLGQPTFDRFADEHNHKTQSFNSRYLCPNTAGTNAFSQNWSHTQLNWLCPPIKDIPATIRHAKACKARGILVTPHWTSSHCCTIIHNGKHFKHFVKDFHIVQLYFTSTCQTSIFKGFTNFNTIAMLKDFT